MGSNKNGVSHAYVSGAVCFLVGSALGVMAVLRLHAPGLAEVGGEWASAARWAAQPVGSIDAHRLLVAISLLFLAASVWRLAKRCAAVEGRVGSTDFAVQLLRRKLKKERQLKKDGRVGSTDFAVQLLRRRLKKERQPKKDALEDLEKQMSDFSIAMANNDRLKTEKARVETEAHQFQDKLKYMIEYLESQKARVETEAPQPQKMMQEQQNAMIESLKSMIRMCGMQPEDDRDKK